MTPLRISELGEYLKIYVTLKSRILKSPSKSLKLRRGKIQLRDISVLELRLDRAEMREHGHRARRGGDADRRKGEETADLRSKKGKQTL